MNDFTSDNQTEVELIRQKLSRLVRRYSFPEKVSLAQEYQLPPGVLAWLDKTASEVSQGKPDAACKSLHDEKDADVKLIAEKLIALIFTDSRNTSHEQQGLEKKFREMRDFIASELCVHYAEDTIKFLLSHGDALEFMKDTDAFLISEGLSGHELASALKAILEDQSLVISAKQQLHLRAIAEKAETSAVQIKRVGSKNLEIPKVPEVNSRPAEIEPLPKDGPPPIPDREPTTSPAAPLHQGKAPPGAETVLTAQQAGIGIADFRIRRVISDGFFAKQYTAVFCSSEYSEAIVKHAFPEAKRSTKWSSKSEPPAMLVSGKISPGEVRESLSKSLSAFRLDQKTNKVSFQR